MPGDLHTHTNFSDGSSEIELLPFLAGRAGLTHLAVSDHDTLLAARYARAHPCCEGVTLLPAAELTGFDRRRGRRVHLLCYCPQETPELAAFCETMGRRRNEAAERSIAQLEQMYPQFTRAAALAYAARSGVTYKTHLIRVLYDYGYTDGVYRELYRTLFGRPDGLVLHEPAYDDVYDVLSMLRRTGGVTVLAHPSVYRSMELAAELAEQGWIDGVEIDHPRNTPEDRQALHELARRYGLIVTGGTDFHGLHTSRPVPLGTYTTADSQIARILALADERQNAPRLSPAQEAHAGV